MLKSSSVSGEIYTQERTDGSQSDTALGTVGGGSKKRRSSLSARVVAIVGNRRSRSTSQISGPGEWWLHIPPAVCDVNVAKCPPNIWRRHHTAIHLQCKYWIYWNGTYMFRVTTLTPYHILTGTFSIKVQCQGSHLISQSLLGFYIWTKNKIFPESGSSLATYTEYTSARHHMLAVAG